MTRDEAPQHIAQAMSQDDLRPAIASLVTRHLGSEIVALEPISPGLGTRRFYRARLRGDGPQSLVARVEMPEDPARRPVGAAQEPPLEPIRRFLADHGIPVPGSFGHDPTSGIDLLEDAGDETLEGIAAAAPPEERRALYAEALSWLPRLQGLAPPEPGLPAFTRQLDTTLFAYKAQRVIEWLLPWALGRPPRPSETDCVREGFGAIADCCAEAPRRLAHRDFKAANIHVRRAREPGTRLMLIDLQGAFLAPPEYDAVCLLRDAHVPLPDDEVVAHLEALRPRLPDAPPEDVFAMRFALLTLTRVGKDLAVYLYAAEALGDARYLRFVPHAARVLRGAAGDARRFGPRLENLTELFASIPDAVPQAPVDARGASPCAR